MYSKVKMTGLLLAGGILILPAVTVRADVGEGQLYAGVTDAIGAWLESEGDLLLHSDERMQLEPAFAGTELAEVEGHEAAEVASEFADIAIATVLNYVNLRERPTVESEVVGKLYANSAATILETVYDEAGELWYRIDSGSVKGGYVKAEYVEVGNEELIRQVSTRYAAVRTTTLFVRMEPGTDASILTMLPDGDDVVVLEEREDGWLKVSTEEGDGYVSEDYVELWTDYVEAESKEEEEARLAREEEARRAAAEAAENARRAREEAARREQEEAERAREEARAKQQKSNSSGTGVTEQKKNTSSGTGVTEQKKNTSSGSSATEQQKPVQEKQETKTETENKKQNVSNGQAVVNYAAQFVGNPYVYGGSSLTNGADCSGFVMSVYAAFGISLPHSSSALRSVGYGVSVDQIQPGDIVCYSGHVGIYAGNNTLLHASSPSSGIKYTSPITYREILAVRRIF